MKHSSELNKVVVVTALLLFYLLSVGMAQGKRSTAVTYDGNILPLLKTNCQPCHFEGGTVYGKLPFTDYKTVKMLGKKLTTRLQAKEKQEQKELVLSWVKNGSKEK